MWSDAYSRCLEHLRKPRIVADTRVEDADAGVEEGHAGAERGDAALEGCGGAIVHVDAQSLASVVWFSYAMSNALQKRVKTTRISKHRMRRQYLGPA